jgi:hypothetical protein
MMVRKSYAWKNCEDCGKKVKRGWMKDNKIFCYNCWRKHFHNNMYIPFAVSLTDALDTVREVRCSCHSSPSGVLSLPRILIGRKVKLVLAEE